MAKKLILNLITPEKQLISNLEVDMVILPAFEGEMGVLPRHAKMIVQLGMGSLRYKQGDKKEEFAVLGGFAEVLHDTVNVFAEGADIDFELAEIEIKQAIARMKVKKKHI